MAVVFTLGGVGVVKGHVRFGQQAMLELIREINPYLIESGFVDGAPFKLVSGIVRYTDVASAEPRIDPVDRAHAELPFAVDMSIPEFRAAPKDVVRTRMDTLICDALFRIAALHQRPRSGIDAYCKRLNPSQS